MTVARATKACVLRVSTSDGKSVVMTLDAGETLEALDPLAAEALAAQVAAGELQAVAVRPGRVDHDVDSQPRIDRPGKQPDTAKERVR